MNDKVKLTSLLLIHHFSYCPRIFVDQNYRETSFFVHGNCEGITEISRLNEHTNHTTSVAFQKTPKNHDTAENHMHMKNT